MEGIQFKKMLEVLCSQQETSLMLLKCRDDHFLLRKHYLQVEVKVYCCFH